MIIYIYIYDHVIDSVSFIYDFMRFTSFEFSVRQHHANPFASPCLNCKEEV